ncbi:MAG: MoaD/ThiS family protein [Acidithiobacillales bacterium]
MRVEVLLFAALKDEIGMTFAVELREPATVADLRLALEASHPVFARFGRRAMVAVNEAWAADGDPVRPGDTVALLPPVAGG